MFYLELLLFMQGLLIILMIIFLHKMNQVKSKMDSITKEVNEYLSFIEEDVHREEEQLQNDKVGKNNRDEVQNHIIQAVLKEYFP